MVLGDFLLSHLARGIKGRHSLESERFQTRSEGRVSKLCLGGKKIERSIPEIRKNGKDQKSQGGKRSGGIVPE